ncbi:hydroxymethylglutaryl-CoA synthase 1 [Exaiptasia diaphana]|uniref:Hydroxymethylglutaryl-CoA synthase n=1 Tax=Exaiptasia diaphana TaxID=2652724 RepID=A0A913WZ22_EXADI|nr:hydroxymethylglutaryl-CoA synthase 1 [Exaiptasia diaphana]KXJ16686.1 Hydroxymethylglutaryl-CoA synthase, cytoplasmic [Exaiptasia diaphana]
MASNNCNSSNHWPEDVGILALEVYFPKTFVSQEKLEEYDGVSKGKYTIGLGQRKMGFCGDREDINSLALTVVHNLLERNSIDPKTIGRLEVGTETLIDKSKSVKTVLMQLFEESGNSEIEGVDTTNACYGGTQALFNALAWVESSSWDGRLAIVVAADIAVYAAGNARSSGGAGAVAMLIGPNAPIAVERGLRAVHMQHAYDFYKPNMSSEYPVVDGKLSIKCYFTAIDHCYSRYKDKLNKKEGKISSLNDIDYMAFHTPFCKIVQKSLARMVLADFLAETNPEQNFNGYASLLEYRGLTLNETLENESVAKDIERASVKASQDIFNAKALLSLNIARDVGNMYTPSLYSGLVSLLYSIPASDLAGKRIGMYSYGSGLASAMYSLRVSMDTSHGSPLDVLLTSVQDIPARLAARTEVSPEDFVKTLEIREQAYHSSPYTPSCSLESLFKGTYYLNNIDKMYRRSYSRMNEDY